MLSEQRPLERLYQAIAEAKDTADVELKLNILEKALADPKVASLLEKDDKARELIQKTYQESLTKMYLELRELTVFSYAQLEEIDNYDVGSKLPISQRINIGIFSALSEYVTNAILHEPDLNKRTILEARFVRLAQMALINGDLNTCFAINSGLEANAVYRLKATNEGLPADTKDAMKIMSELKNDYTQSLVKERRKDFIPYFGQYRTALTFAHIAYKTTAEKVEEYKKKGEQVPVGLDADARELENKWKTLVANMTSYIDTQKRIAKIKSDDVASLTPLQKNIYKEGLENSLSAIITLKEDKKSHCLSIIAGIKVLRGTKPENEAAIARARKELADAISDFNTYSKLADEQGNILRDRLSAIGIVADKVKIQKLQHADFNENEAQRADAGNQNMAVKEAEDDAAYNRSVSLEPSGEAISPSNVLQANNKSQTSVARVISPKPSGYIHGQIKHISDVSKQLYSLKSVINATAKTLSDLTKLNEKPEDEKFGKNITDIIQMIDSSRNASYEAMKVIENEITKNRKFDGVTTGVQKQLNQVQANGVKINNKFQELFWELKQDLAKYDDKFKDLKTSDLVNHKDINDPVLRKKAEQLYLVFTSLDYMSKYHDVLRGLMTNVKLLKESSKPEILEIEQAAEQKVVLNKNEVESMRKAMAAAATTKKETDLKTEVPQTSSDTSWVSVKYDDVPENTPVNQPSTETNKLSANREKRKAVNLTKSQFSAPEETQQNPPLEQTLFHHPHETSQAPVIGQKNGPTKRK